MEYQPESGYPPKNWLVESILVTLFCCPPFGIAAIVAASKVESKFYAGDIEGAYRAAREAKKWVIVSFFIVVGAIALYILFNIIMFIFVLGTATLTH